jgi:site-specific DNA-methyltransferase (adenine-specific)
MVQEAKAAGQYVHQDMGRAYDKIGIVTIRDILQKGKRLEIPMSLEVLRAAQKAADTGQIELL